MIRKKSDDVVKTMVNESSTTGSSGVIGNRPLYKYPHHTGGILYY